MPRTLTRWPATHPAVLWLIVLGVIFAAETLVMSSLPWVLPDPHPWAVEVVVDALMLTVLVSPALWWTVVRPHREALRLRARFLADLIAATEAERRRIAHELHDGVGQTVTLLVSGLRSLPDPPPDLPECRRLPDLRRLAETALTDVKRLALGLRPSLLDDLGLAPAVERVAEDADAAGPPRVTADVRGVRGVRLPEAAETAVFRIVQEALANAIKHAGAAAVAIRVAHANGRVELEVIDDGRGLADPRAAWRGGPPGHLGLRGMQERARLLGGHLRIDSRPGRGTRVWATIPAEGGRR